MKNKKAFTLIEILVVVGVIGVILLSLSGVMSGIFSSQNQDRSDNKIDQSGTWILSELRKNILNANSSEGKFSCSTDELGGNSIIITNIKDLEETEISCFEDENGALKIASTSAAREVVLFKKNKDLEIFDCTSFVSCSTLPSLQLSDVKFNFTLKAGNENLSSGTTRVFLMDVTLRN